MHLHMSIQQFQLLQFNVTNYIYQVFVSNTNNLHIAECFRITNNNNHLQNNEQFYLTHRLDLNRYYKSGPG